MTVHSRLARAFCALILALLTAAPLSAAVQRKRTVLHPGAEKVSISGTVTDAVTGLPLKGATVASDTSSVLTDDAGHYTLTCMNGNIITASRPGYTSVQHPATGTPLDFALPQSPTITVRTTKGDSIAFDAASVKFGYVVIFQGYAGGETLSLCKPGDPDWQPAKADIKKITGPAHPITSACCDRGPVMAVDVEMKSGEKVTAAMNDSCIGYEMDVYGIERSSATPKYIHLTDVSEIVFP